MRTHTHTQTKKTHASLNNDQIPQKKKAGADPNRESYSPDVGITDKIQGEPTLRYLGSAVILSGVRHHTILRNLHQISMLADSWSNKIDLKLVCIPTRGYYIRAHQHLPEGKAGRLDYPHQVAQSTNGTNDRH